MPDPLNFNAAVNVGSTYVPVDWEDITPDAGALERPLRAIRADTAGTVTVKTAGSGDTERVLRFAATETRYGMFTHVTAATAGGIEGAV